VNLRRLISVVVPCYNESKVFPYLQDALSALADAIEKEFRVEIVLVDDGSRDSTWEQIQAFAARDARVRGVALSRNFGHQMALTCAYDCAQGDAIVCMDADLQDSPEVVLEMITKWKEGNDLVPAIRRHREGETRFKLLLDWSPANLLRGGGGPGRWERILHRLPCGAQYAVGAETEPRVLNANKDTLQ
jgi:glycosyltransferase involved in cell wall biosynthesis